MPGRRNNRQLLRPTKSLPPGDSINYTHDFSCSRKSVVPSKNALPMLFYLKSFKTPSWTSSSVLFEFIFYMYLLVAFLCQYLFIYRSVWWYPERIPPSATAVNFHLIDLNLTCLLLLLLSVWGIRTMLWDIIRPNGEKTLYVAVWCGFVFIVSMGWVFETLRNVVILYNTVSLFRSALLWYPIIAWVIKMLWSRSNVYSDIRRGVYKLNRLMSSSKHWLRLQYHYGCLINPESSDHLSQDPEKIREDVQILACDVNSRSCETVLRAAFCYYYAGLIPVFFAQNEQYFDSFWSYQHALLLLINSAVMIFANTFPHDYLDTLSKTALLLGKFEPEEDENSGSTKIWSPTVVYRRNDVVMYDQKRYRALTDHNVAQPGNEQHGRFYSFFVDPIAFLKAPSALLVTTIIYQLFLLVVNSAWERVTSLAVMIFFNFYALFYLLKDCLVMNYDKYNCNEILNNMSLQDTLKNKTD